MRRALPLALSLWLLAADARAQVDVSTSTFLGGAADDSVRGARVLADGRIVVAATLSGLPVGVAAEPLGGAGASDPGVLLWLTPDGRSVERALRVAREIHDLASDDADRLYVAAGDDGVLAVAADGASVLFRAMPGHVRRVDVSDEGDLVAALVPSNVDGADDTPGAGRIHLYDGSGAALGDFAGHRNTLDIAVDGASDTIVLVGWRQANASAGGETNPVQIAYLRGVAANGSERWTAYDWSTDEASPDFLNRMTNNMADTRGYRVSVGRDGRLLAAFECAGGNHIFRFDPFDITASAAIVGGDEYHGFQNTRSEHKTFFGIYDPASGAYATGQQLVGRLSSGRGNTVRVRLGSIETDETGRVYVAGAAASGLPIETLPPGTGDYTGGAYLVIMSADLRERVFVTRMTPRGQSHVVDARLVGGEAVIALGGTTRPNDMGVHELYVQDALASTSGGGEDGFFTLFGGPGGTPLPRSDAGPGAPRGDAGGASGPGSDGGSGGGASESGCGCRAAGGSPRGASLGLLLLAALLHRARRAR